MVPVAGKYRITVMSWVDGVLWTSGMEAETIDDGAPTGSVGDVCKMSDSWCDLWAVTYSLICDLVLDGVRVGEVKSLGTVAEALVFLEHFLYVACPCTDSMLAAYIGSIDDILFWSCTWSRCFGCAT